MQDLEDARQFTQVREHGRDGVASGRQALHIGVRRQVEGCQEAGRQFLQPSNGLRRHGGRFQQHARQQVPVSLLTKCNAM